MMLKWTIIKNKTENFKMKLKKFNICVSKVAGLLLSPFHFILQPIL